MAYVLRRHIEQKAPAGGLFDYRNLSLSSIRPLLLFILREDKGKSKKPNHESNETSHTSNENRHGNTENN